MAQAAKVARVQAGVIGAGIGKFHAEGYQTHPKAECVAICDVNRVAAEELAAKWGVEDVFTDHRQMLKLKGLNAVSVCVPNTLHRPLAVDCLKAGMNVLCEKPLSVNAREGQKIVAAAQQSGKTLMMQFNNRYRPEAQLLRSYIDEGTLGDIYFARCGWIRRNGIPGWGGWFTQKELAGGGPLIDLAVHMLDLTMWLMGNPEPVTCMASTYSVFGPKMEALGPWGTPNPKGKFDVEDMAVGMIKFAGGQTILLEASWASRVHREWVYSTLCGTKAGASLERVFDADGEDDTSRDTLRLFTQKHGQPVNEDLIWPADPAMGRLRAVHHFCDCLVSGQAPGSPGTDGQRIMRLLDAMYQSAQTGKAVSLK